MINVGWVGLFQRREGVLAFEPLGALGWASTLRRSSALRASGAMSLGWLESPQPAKATAINRTTKPPDERPGTRVVRAITIRSLSTGRRDLGSRAARPGSPARIRGQLGDTRTAPWLAKPRAGGRGTVDLGTFDYLEKQWANATRWRSSLAEREPLRAWVGLRTPKLVRRAFSSA